VMITFSNWLKTNSNVTTTTNESTLTNMLDKLVDNMSYEQLLYEVVAQMSAVGELLRRVCDDNQIDFNDIKTNGYKKDEQMLDKLLGKFNGDAQGLLDEILRQIDNDEAAEILGFICARNEIDLEQDNDE